MLSEDRKKEYLSIDFNDIATLRDVVSHKYDRANNKIIKPKFPATEEFVLEKGEYYNDQKIVTTVGRYMVNRAVFRDKILSLIGYQNKVITAKVYSGDIDRTLTELLRNDKLTVQDFKDYVTRLENFSTSLINTTTNSFTEKTVATNAKVAKRKQELLKKYEKELANNDIAVAVKIENELVDLAKKELEGDPGMDSYNSGARGSFGSNYKELNIMKGPVFNPVTREWDIVETSYDDGLAKKDLHVHGNSIATGAYPKAIGTAVSGHMSKQITASLETMVLDDNVNSYCGTKKTFKQFIPAKSKGEFIGRTISVNGKPVRLETDNIDKYANTTVDIYSPLGCAKVNGGKICGRCGDSRAIELGYIHIGIAATALASTIKNKKMKQFHSTTVSLTKLDKNKLFF